MIYRPNLYPNNKTDGTEINWHDRLKLGPEKYFVSEKLEGIRVQIYFDKFSRCIIFSRSIKKFNNFWINNLQQQLNGALKGPVYVEGEFFCRGMRFNEIQHFSATANVTTRTAIAKTTRDVKNGKFQGRGIGWLSNYYHDFNVYLFDIHYPENPEIFQLRIHRLANAFDKMRRHTNNLVIIPQTKLWSVEQIIDTYDKIVFDGGEGILLKHEANMYKYGRNTLLEASVFKMKDEFNWYYGTVMSVLEGTIVDPWLTPDINELGFSVTSKLKEDRMPSGRAKGFRVKWRDKELTVTLKGFNNDDKAKLLNSNSDYIGETIKFLAMKPTKVDGVPRMAKYIKQSQPTHP